MPKARPRKSPLSRDIIVAAAMDMLNQDGIDALSMRKLGALLGVEAMTLYHHVAGKEELLDLIVERVALGAAASGMQEGPWRARLEAFARDIYASLTANPGVAALAATRPVRSEAALARFFAAIEGLVSAGFSPEQAYFTLNALALMASGHALAALDGAAGPDAAAYLQRLEAVFPDAAALHARHEKLFEFALTTFLNGLPPGN
jgi:AcrR family transcriptional regulator